MVRGPLPLNRNPYPSRGTPKKFIFEVVRNNGGQEVREINVVVVIKVQRLKNVGHFLDM